MAIFLTPLIVIKKENTMTMILALEPREMRKNISEHASFASSRIRSNSETSNVFAVLQRTAESMIWGKQHCRLNLRRYIGTAMLSSLETIIDF